MKTTFRTGIYIARPPKTVTQVFLDPANAVLWTTGLARFEVVSGRPGEVGSIARLHYLQANQPYVMQDVLLAAEPDRRYVSRVSGEALTAEIETSLSPSRGGTELSIRWTGTGKRLMLRLLLPFLRGNLVRQAQADLKKLKDLVEEGPATGSPPG